MSNNIGVTDNYQVNSVQKETEIKDNSSKTITYSYNPAIIPGMDKDEAGRKSHGWLQATCKWDEAAITEMIRTRAYMASEVKDGHKIKANVKAIYNFVLDFDTGHPSLKDFLTLAADYQFCWIAHTTVNHQKPKIDKDTKLPIPGSEKDKFRVIIPLSEPISESALAEAAKYWCSNKRFPTLDASSFQGSRYFMVNPNADVHIHDTLEKTGGDPTQLGFMDPYEIIPKSFKRTLTNRVKKVQTHEENLNELEEKNKRSYYIPELVVKTDKGEEVFIHDIHEHIPILCPFCDPATRQHPDKHNAFVNFNKAGQQFLHCTSEKTTYWSDPKEIDPSKSSLFFNETLGYASRIAEDDDGVVGYNVFKNNDDWLSYCYHNDLDSKIKIYLPRLRIIFSPTEPSGLQKEYFNMFQESEYLTRHDNSMTLLSGDEILRHMEKQTPVISEIMYNIFGDPEYLKRFLNWNAVILKNRIKVDTSWLITSKEEGIGKGLMFDRILQPIYGQRQSILEIGNEIAKKFNAQDQTLWLKVFDEVYAPGDYKENLARKEWLKYIITARKQTIELKGVDKFQMQNHMNIILYSNNECPIFLGGQDRRFSVIRNENAKKTDQLSFYKNIPDMRKRIDAELSTFADLLLRYDCDVELANKAVDTLAKDKLKETTADEFEEFAKAIVEKDDSYFLLSEIYFPSFDEKLFNKDAILSAEGLE